MPDEPATGPAYVPEPDPWDSGPPDPGPPKLAPPAGMRGRTDLTTILATEHWSLLGTRSLTWSEVMSRITIHLTVSSALLVVLALVGQATGFGRMFWTLAIGFSSVVLLMGTLTEVRVLMASMEDRELLRAMNRLRRAYVDVAPEVAPYLTASIHDDEAGAMETSTLGIQRPMLMMLIGGTYTFLSVVNAVVAGALGGLVAFASGAPLLGVVVAGLGLGLGWLVGQQGLAIRTVRSVQRTSGIRFPHPE